MNGKGQILFWVAGTLAVLLALYLLRGILLPFVGGAGAAYFLDPLADRLERLGLSRTLSTLFITVGFFLVIGLAVVLLVPFVQHEVSLFISRVPQYLQALLGRLQPLVNLLHADFKVGGSLDPHKLAADYGAKAVAWGGAMAGSLFTGGLALVNLLSLIVVTPVVTFYLLRDWDRMVAQMDRLLPLAHAATIRDQFREIDRTLAGFLRGQATVCLILGLYYGTGLALVGLDFGFLIGFLTGVFTFVPYVGMLIGVGLALLVALMQFDSWTQYALMAGVFLVGQFLEGNFLTPNLVGGRIGLHPVWIIFSLLAGGVLFGFTGILLAVPTAAAVGVLVRFATARYLASPLYRGRT